MRKKDKKKKGGGEEDKTYIKRVCIEQRAKRSDAERRSETFGKQ